MRRDQRVDAALALGAFATATAVMYLHGFGEPGADVRDGDATGVALVGLMTLPLAVRRRHPFAVFALAAVAVAAIHALRYPGELGLWPALAVYSVAAHARTPRAGRVGGLLAGATLVVLSAIALVVDPDPGILAGVVAWAGAWVGGDLARQRRERMAALEERAARAERDAERERRLAAAEERTRIARELHDSAGHAMNVVLVQAGAARLLRERDPQASRRAIETIEEVARGTLGEIDRLVRALREDAPVDEERGAPLPGLDELDRLVSKLRAGGVAVSVRVDGPRRPLPTGVDRAAYRILQEALTNAALHGRGSAEVTVRFGSRELDVEVANPVRANGGARAGGVRAGGGHGLVGMRERASLLGGRLDSGRTGDAFRVHAVLPYGAESP